ncbi:hypothetical protein ACGFMM_30815 [Streptomyces sp. NPDC048604]|uniref:hypothetical protein n=1 Tax=Streptomyces sp. NPDC048604 TaxID=3365578 RepID=UPI003716DF33
MHGMLSLKMNEAAVQALGVLTGPAAMAPPGGLAPGLRDQLASGISRRGDVLTWADSVGKAENAPSFFNDLTAWECSDSSFHLEDHAPVPVPLVDHTPQIAEDDQRTLLVHGVAFAMEFGRLVHGLDRPVPVRCIVAANETNATFRFHQIRPGEFWNHPDLDRYASEKLIVIDFEPAAA